MRLVWPVAALAIALIAMATACGDDDSGSGDATATPGQAGPTTVEESIIRQTVDGLSREPGNEFDPDDVEARLVTYAEAYAEIAAEAPDILGQLRSAPPGKAWLVRVEGTFIYTASCPTGGCEPAEGTYFLLYNEAGQPGQAIFVGKK